MTDHLGEYYRLGSAFSKLIGQPKIMAAATKLGLPRKRLMYLVLKLLAGCTTPTTATGPTGSSSA